MVLLVHGLYQSVSSCNNFCFDVNYKLAVIFKQQDIQMTHLENSYKITDHAGNEVHFVLNLSLLDHAAVYIAPLRLVVEKHLVVCK